MSFRNGGSWAEAHDGTVKRAPLRALGMAVLLVLAGCSRQAPLPIHGTVPTFVLTSQTGETFRSDRALGGKIWVADFMFTSCMGPCPRMAQQMRWVQQQTAALPDVRIVSFTVDPETDTPPVLTEFAKKHHADTTRWSFLTGPREVLHHIGRDVMKLNDVDGSYNHSTRFVLVDRGGSIRGYYETSGKEGLEQLVKDIRRLAEER